MIRLDLLNVGLVEETGGILLVLRAPAQERLLIIETGILEGQYIAMEAQGVRSERPLTQDLLANVIGALGATLSEARIEEFHDETFFAKIVLNRADGGAQVSVDCRPSDAIALALHTGVPIMVSDEVLERMGIPEERQGRFAELFDQDDEPGERIIH